MALAITKLAHLRIPLEDVRQATNNFHNDNIISSGGFGPAYKGSLLWSGEWIKIAARRLDRRYGLGDYEFWTEVSVLSDLKHPNLVSMIGYCDEEGEKIIITEYVAKGSLSQFLNSPTLTWAQRLKICIGVARALSYLHYDARRDYSVIHRNLNSYTILLDENWEPKLSGFEISIKQSVNRMDHVILCEPIGEEGYMDPQIEKNRGVTSKSDIYSFGVVLYEIMCGRLAFIQNDANMFLVPLARYHHKDITLQLIIQPDLWKQMSTNSLVKYSRLAYSCTEEDQAYRLDIGYIVDELNEALELHLAHKIPVNPFHGLGKEPFFHRQRKAIQLQPPETSGKNLEHLKIPLTDIQLATEKFSQRYEIGFTSFWALYRVNLQLPSPVTVDGENEHKVPHRHNTVIIKRFIYYEQREKAFYTEIGMLSSVKHPNIVTLLGFCVEKHEMIIVTENTFNGTLRRALIDDNRKRILTWEKRLKICIDIAKALNYIHFEMEDQKTIINRYICSDNIALDEQWDGRIFSFVLSEFLPENQDDESLHLDISGTKCYMDPVYGKTRKLKRESDVYAFGVVMFELLFGRLAYDPIYLKESDKGLAFVVRRRFNMGTLDDMIDPIIKDKIGENNFILNKGPNNDSVRIFIEIAYKCVAETQEERPRMIVVLKQLEKALFLQKNNKDNPVISLDDIQLATQNFHAVNCIGGGGFGKVYIGKLQDGDGYKTIVAKRLDTRLGQGEQQFLSELQILLEYQHKSVIGLVGYCDEKSEKIIVYEYASRRSLDRYLDDARLTWMKRLKICIKVASALDFLHGGAGKQAKVVHRDIKTANILLTHDWEAKLADFELSLISPLAQETDYIINRPCGTKGYVDPLYEKSKFLTIKSDIYSFGVVLFEILCGRSMFTIYKQEGVYLPNFVKSKFEEGKHDEVVFKPIREQIVPKSLTAFQEIAYQCLQHESEKRPTTTEVLMQLKKALEFQKTNSYQENQLRSAPSGSAKVSDDSGLTAVKDK